MENILSFVSMFGQELLFGASLLLFIISVSLKMGCFPEKQESITKSQWLRWKREGVM